MRQAGGISVTRKAILAMARLVLLNLLIWAVALATLHHFALLPAHIG